MPFRLAGVSGARIGVQIGDPVAMLPMTVSFGARQLMLRLKHSGCRRLGHPPLMDEGFGLVESNRGHSPVHMLASPSLVDGGCHTGSMIHL